METLDGFLTLEEVTTDVKERYYIIVSRTGFVAHESQEKSYFTANGAACIPTQGIDTTEIANEFLEDYCGEDAAEEGFFDPLVLYGEICNPAALEEEMLDDYFLFVPDYNGTMLIGYNIYTISGIETLVEMIVPMMKERIDLEIEDLIIFRGEEVPMSVQITRTFDQADIDGMLGDDDA